MYHAGYVDKLTINFDSVYSNISTLSSHGIYIYNKILEYIAKLEAPTISDHLWKVISNSIHVYWYNFME